MFEKTIKLDFPITFGDAAKIYEEIICTGIPCMNIYHTNSKNTKEGICFSSDFHSREGEYDIFNFQEFHPDCGNFYYPLRDKQWREIEDFEIDYMNTYKNGKTMFQKDREFRYQVTPEGIFIKGLSSSRKDLSKLLKEFEHLILK